MKDYVAYNFRQLFRFRYKGFPIIAPMVSIRDFSSGDPDTPTPVQFFIEPAETECCDLPCGCQFSRGPPDLRGAARDHLLQGLTRAS